MVLSSEKPAVISKADEKDNEPGLIHAFSNSVSELISLAKTHFITLRIGFEI